MQNILKYRFLIFFFCVNLPGLYAQHTSELSENTITEVYPKYITSIKNKIEKVNAKLNENINRTRSKFEIQKEKYLKMLLRLNSKFSEGLVSKTNLSALFKRFEADKMNGSITCDISAIEYDPNMDTIATALRFLRTLENIRTSEENKEIELTLTEISQLKSRLAQSKVIGKYFTDKVQVIQQFAKTYHLPKSLSRFRSLHKTAYYYTLKIQRFKDQLKSCAINQQKIIVLLTSLPVFQKFFRENSQLALLFSNDSDTTDLQNLPGLQARTSINEQLQQIISAVPVASQISVRQSLANSQTIISNIKDRINRVSVKNTVLDLPDFKFSDQKSNNFLRRLEFGTNVQFAGRNNIPRTSDFAFSLGYKLNKKSIIGTGIAFKMGLGTIRHISISYEGVGLRTFVDYKIKNKIFLSGDYEMNHASKFQYVSQLKKYAEWTHSGLLGMSIKYKVSKKLNGQVQFLLDFLNLSQQQQTSFLLFRVGYTFSK